MKTLGIDIGGSALKGAVVDTTTGKLTSERFRIDTPDNLTPKEMAGAVKAMAAHFKWKGPIGIGFPGVIEDSTIWTSANLDKAFIGCDAAKLFGKATGCPIAMINDAAAAGVAEMHFGAGRGFMGKALLLTLGTGVILDTAVWNFGGAGTHTYEITSSDPAAALTTTDALSVIQFSNFNTAPVTLAVPIIAIGAALAPAGGGMVSSN